MFLSTVFLCFLSCIFMKWLPSVLFIRLFCACLQRGRRVEYKLCWLWELLLQWSVAETKNFQASKSYQIYQFLHENLLWGHLIKIKGAFAGKQSNHQFIKFVDKLNRDGAAIWCFRFIYVYLVGCYLLIFIIYA